MPENAFQTVGRAQGASCPTFSCAPNFRDLADTSGELPLRSGLVYRSDMVLRPDEAEAEMLRRLGVRIVFDLRGANEAAAAPNTFWVDHQVEVLQFDIGADLLLKGSLLDMLKDEPSVQMMRVLVDRIYRSIPIAAAGALRTLFDRLAAGEAPVVIHCVAGKDRTGFVCAMLLAALGAPRDVIHADYLASRGRMTPERIAHIRETVSRAAGRDVDTSTIAPLIGVEKDFLDASFDRIDEEYGGVDAFLEQTIGLDEDKRLRVRKMLLEI
jgi:protein-tyrosine phosphatase